MQTETCTDSDGGTSGSVDQEKHIKKEEAEEEGYICKLDDTLQLIMICIYFFLQDISPLF